MFTKMLMEKTAGRHVHKKNLIILYTVQYTKYSITNSTLITVIRS
jgi:hypothetical protein